MLNSTQNTEKVVRVSDSFPGDMLHACQYIVTYCKLSSHSYFFISYPLIVAVPNVLCVFKVSRQMSQLSRYSVRSESGSVMIMVGDEISKLGYHFYGVILSP
jgi:hypothetical protein